MDYYDTIELMQSGDYKDRFVAEYIQLNLRCAELDNLCKAVKKGTASEIIGNYYKHSWDLIVLKRQLKAMRYYRDAMIERACIEHITLP